MDASQVFSIANTVALISWIFLIVAPRFIVTRKLIMNSVVPILLSVAYLIVIVATFGQAEGGFGSLKDVMKLFTYEWAVLGGWIHYLAFDMLIGVWEVRDAEEKGISHWFVIPCLVLTFLLGPIGYLLYRVVSAVAPVKSHAA